MGQKGEVRGDKGQERSTGWKGTNRVPTFRFVRREAVSSPGQSPSTQRLGPPFFSPSFRVPGL